MNNEDNKTDISNFEKIGTELGKLVKKKNDAYGDSFSKSKNFLEILYPNGIMPENYSDMLCVLRIFDKLKRIATDRDAFGENPHEDLVGITIRMMAAEMNTDTENK
jgi:hypothetical protein